MVLEYDPGAAYLATALRWQFTVVPFVLCRKEFWGFMALHLSIGILYRLNALPGADHAHSFFFIDWHDMKVISAITTFFEVFYTNTTFSRYLRLYNLTRTMITLVSEFCFESALHVKSTALQHVRLSSRWFCASTALYLVEKTGKSQEEVYKFMEEQFLLKPDERQFLCSNFQRAQRPVVLMHLASKVIRDGHTIAATAKKAPGNALKGLTDKLIASRRCMCEIEETLSLPIPFPYFHLLNVMIVVNLMLWSYGMGVTDSVFAPIAFFFAALIFMGMMELASQLSDPFGDDDTDFPVEEWIAEAMDDSSMINEYSYEKFDDILAAETPLTSSGKVDNGFLEEHGGLGG